MFREGSRQTPVQLLRVRGRPRRSRSYPRRRWLSRRFRAERSGASHSSTDSDRFEVSWRKCWKEGQDRAAVGRRQWFRECFPSWKPEECSSASSTTTVFARRPQVHLSSVGGQFADRLSREGHPSRGTQELRSEVGSPAGPEFRTTSSMSGGVGVLQEYGTA